MTAQGPAGHPLKTRKSHLFTEAAAADERYAMPLVGLADAWSMIGAWHWKNQHFAFTRAMKYLDKALLIDDALPEAFLARAFIQSHYGEKAQKVAENDFSFARRADPRNASALQWNGGFLARRGDVQDGINQVQLARHLDPFAPIVAADLGWLHYLNGDFDRSIEISHRVLEDIDASFFPARHYGALARIGKGDYGGAAAYLATAATLNSRLVGVLGYSYAMTGEKEAMERAEEIANQLRNEKDIAYASQADAALVYVGLGVARKDEKLPKPKAAGFVGAGL